MIVLYTDVISEAMRPSGDSGVIGWLNEQPAETLYLTTITLAELSPGTGASTSGFASEPAFTAIGDLLALFEGRVLSFDTLAAKAHAEIASSVRPGGNSLHNPHAYVAAIAASRGFAVGTRDTEPFEAAGVAIINPWDQK